VLVDLRGKLKQCVVDEFQDVSKSQHVLLKLLINGNGNNNNSNYDVPKLFCAGDTDQSIYGWRGASPQENIGMFLKDFPQGVVLPFGTSYRLPKAILKAANSLINKKNDSTKSFTTSPAEITSNSLAGLSDASSHPDSGQQARVIVRGLWDANEEGRWVGERAKRASLLEDENTSLKPKLTLFHSITFVWLARRQLRKF
tara:strand:+ start:1327 stop:1923 length:597 start_codon:yes stop_codon:yes gene_type:complete